MNTLTTEIKNGNTVREIEKAIDLSRNSWTGCYIETPIGYVMVELGVPYLMVDVNGTWFTSILVKLADGYTTHFILDKFTLVNHSSMNDCINMIENMQDVDTHNLVVMGSVTSLHQYLLDNTFQLGALVRNIKEMTMYLSVGYNITEMTYYTSRNQKTAWYLQKDGYSIEIAVSVMVTMGKQSAKVNGGDSSWWNYGWSMKVHKRDHMGRVTITKYTQNNK